MAKETIILDFDGTLHSYKSGWQGVDVIPDPPTDGAREAVAALRERYNCVVVSSRCAEKSGGDAIRAWLRKWRIEVDGVQADKPPHVAIVDDRAFRFEGNWKAVIDGIADAAVPWTERAWRWPHRKAAPSEAGPPPKVEMAPELTDEDEEILDRVWSQVSAGGTFQVAPEEHRDARFLVKNPGPHRYATTQVDLEGNSAAAVLALASAIPANHLAGDGRETQPHVSVLYGLTSDDCGPVRRALSGFRPFTLRLGVTNFFPAAESNLPGEGDGCDVVYAEVNCPELHRVNAYLRATLGAECKFPVYVPHATLACVKQGCGKRHAACDALVGCSYLVDCIYHYTRAGKRTPISLEGGR